MAGLMLVLVVSLSLSCASESRERRSGGRHRHSLDASPTSTHLPLPPHLDPQPQDADERPTGGTVTRPRGDTEVRGHGHAFSQQIYGWSTAVVRPFRCRARERAGRGARGWIWASARSVQPSGRADRGHAGGGRTVVCRHASFLLAPHSGRRWEWRGFVAACRECCAQARRVVVRGHAVPHPHTGQGAKGAQSSTSPHVPSPGTSFPPAPPTPLLVRGSCWSRLSVLVSTVNPPLPGAQVSHIVGRCERRRTTHRGRGGCCQWR